jgi:5-methylthioadenosine/S-adenosylhomocysteine deaminase
MDADRRVLDRGAVAIRGERIAAVGTSAELAGWRADRRVDCRHRAVIPGLVDCHTHLVQSLAKGIGDGLPLWPWLRDVMWPYGRALTAEDARAAAYLGAVQSVAGGTTTVLDHHGSPSDLDSVLAEAQAIEDVGLRGVVGRTIRGPRPALGSEVGIPAELTRSVDEELGITRAAIEARPPGSRVAVWPAPANPVHVEQEVFAAGVALAREMGTGWHTHCSEDRADPDRYLAAYGIRPVEWLFREGLLEDHATLAHAIWLNDREIELVGSTAAGVSYNPVSNAYLGAGVMPLRRLRDAGAVVGLGSDGPAVTGWSILECVKQAILLQRVEALDPTAAAAEEALTLATREGARYMGIDAGVLEPGRLADVAVVDLRGPHLVPDDQVVPVLAYLAGGADVEMTIVGGRVIYEGGSCTLVDETTVLAQARARRNDLAARLGWPSRGRSDSA